MASGGQLDLKAKTYDDQQAANAAANFSLTDSDKHSFEEAISDEDYDLLKKEIEETFNARQASNSIKASMVTIGMTSVTVGIVSYLLRAGSLFASLMSSLPLWRSYDPIAIFNGESNHREKRPDETDIEKLKSEEIFESETE